MGTYATFREAVYRAAVALGGVLVASAVAAQDTAKRYPPYPDVWGIDLPMAQERAYGTCGNPRTSLYRHPDGELRFLVFYREATKNKECEGGRAVFFFVDFFQQSITEVSEEVFNSYSFENRRSGYVPGAQRWYELDIGPAGVVRSRNFGPWRRGDCNQNVVHRLERFDPSGALIKTLYLFEILKAPDEITIWPECAHIDPPGPKTIRVVNRSQNIAMLADGTFVAWGEYSPAIFRFTADFETKFRSRHDLHWVGASVMEELYFQRLRVPSASFMVEHNRLYNILTKGVGKR